MTFQVQKVLSVLLRDPSAEQYGFEILKASGVSSGSVYPILARLEKAGWVTSAWEDIDESLAGRRRRRYYRLTAFGLDKSRRLLEETRQMFPNLQEAPV